jgi:hypothetical protein
MTSGWPGPDQLQSWWPLAASMARTQPAALVKTVWPYTACTWPALDDHTGGRTALGMLSPSERGAPRAGMTGDRGQRTACCCVVVS